jgi:hypothetical protein
MAFHRAPVFSSLEFINLDLLEVTSDDQISILGLILLLKVVDAEDLMTLVNAKLDELTVVDWVTELRINCSGQRIVTAILACY